MAKKSKKGVKIPKKVTKAMKKSAKGFGKKSIGKAAMRGTGAINRKEAGIGDW